MKLSIFFVIFLILLCQVNFAQSVNQPLPQQAIPVISTVGKTKDKVLDEKLKTSRKQIQELTSELNSADWNNLCQNISPENFKITRQVLAKYENELNSELSKTNKFYAGYLRREYRITWSILAKYAQNEKYRNSIKQQWQKIIKNLDDVCCVELLNICYYPDTNKYATADDITHLKNRSWDFIEKTSDIYLFDSFCQNLRYSNELTKKLLDGVDDLKRLEKLMKRIDTSNPAGKRAMEVANYSCNIMRIYIDQSYGIPSWVVTPLTFEELIELEPLRYLSDEEVAKRDKEKADAKAAFETKLKNASELVKTEKGRIEIIRTINSPNEIQKLKETYYIALKEYYLNKRDEIYRSTDLSFIHYDVVTSNEKSELRKLLYSKDQILQWHALTFISTVEIRDLVPDLLVLAAEKEQIPDGTLVAAPSFTPGPNFKPRSYHSFVYRLLGRLGNQRTIKPLEQLRQSNKISTELKKDAVLAIEDIKRHIDEQNNAKKYWLNLRRDVREKKVVVAGRIIDIDKPDPEPISPEGFRKWETSDGLFKTTAKFVGLKEIKDKAGKITDKDV
ncbi:MAG: hypothetical protein LBT09_10870, partial [Planctomycetaceae bacterium]|nr:hypothetical protein [Planctomycetaceae bacterium]